MAKGKCRHKKLILGKIFASSFEPDQEPYEAGKLEKIEEKETNQFIAGHYCPICDRIVSVWLDE